MPGILNTASIMTLCPQEGRGPYAKPKDGRDRN